MKVFLVGIPRDSRMSFWPLVKIETDEGICGWGEVYMGNNTPRSRSGCFEDMKSVVIGKDPRQIKTMGYPLSAILIHNSWSIFGFLHKRYRYGSLRHSWKMA